MRLARVELPHGPSPVAVVDNQYVDLHSVEPSVPTCMKNILSAEAPLRAAIEAAAKNPKATRYAMNAVKVLPPIRNPRKILCIGLNYRDHAIEGGKAIPTEPVLFSKFPTTI